MLTGMHPLDIEGDATDEQLKERLRKIRKDNINIIKSKQLKPYTSHLSPSAMDLLLRLLEPNPKKRIRASQLLVHSWIQGTTAFREKMENSDKKLSKFRKFRSKIETKVFQQLLTLSETDIPNDNSGSLFQKAFSSLDKEHKGFLTVDDVSDEDGQTKLAGHDNKIPNEMDLSEFSDLLGEHMVSCYFPSGHILYREGDIGNHMYFVNSGRIQVSTKDGFRATLAHGDTCGEGGLLNENRKRSATLKTQTPVHAIRIDRECFAKYLSSSDSVLGMKLREKVNARKFGRAEYIIGLDKDLVGSKVPMGHVIFNEGDKADGIYILSDGMINVETQNGSKVYDVKPGELFGVQSILMKRDRQALAKCIHPNGCTIKSLSSLSLQNLLETNPSVEETLRELSLRREFRRAVVTKLNRSFKTDSGGLREAFDAIDLDNTGQINIDEVRDLLLNHLGSGSTISEQEIETLLATLDLQRNGVVDFEEFCSIFSR
jgi:CRP-like cAMP-binding protein